MSWSLNVGQQIAASDFDAAVDAATPSPPITDGDTKYTDAVGVAKAALKSVATQVWSDYLSASASGHVKTDTAGSVYDSINVSVFGVEAPAAQPPTPAELAETAEEAAEGDGAQNDGAPAASPNGAPAAGVPQQPAAS